MLSFARTFLPAYLRDLCQRRLNLDHWGNPLDTFAEEILRDFATFVEKHLGDPRAVLAAKAVLWPAGKPQPAAPISWFGWFGTAILEC